MKPRMCFSDLWGGRLSLWGTRPLQLGGTWGYLCTGAPGQPDTAAAAPSGPEWCCLVLGDVTLDAKAIWGRAGPCGHPVRGSVPHMLLEVLLQHSTAFLLSHGGGRRGESGSGSCCPREVLLLRKLCNLHVPILSFPCDQATAPLLLSAVPTKARPRELPFAAALWWPVTSCMPGTARWDQSTLLELAQFACLILWVLLLNPACKYNAELLVLTNYAVMDLSVLSEQG